MSKLIKKIVIVGGGTAGWITAAMLAKQHCRGGNSDVSITLIESDDIPTVGVGEGTFPTMRKTLSTIGISETDLIRRCDATFKQGAKFVSWRLNSDKEFYYHPFNVPSGYGKFDLTAYWQKDENRHQYGRFAEAVDFQDQICEAGLAPKKIVTPEYQSILNYAYHFDAYYYFAQFLKNHVFSICFGIFLKRKRDKNGLCRAVRKQTLNKCSWKAQNNAVRKINKRILAIRFFLTKLSGNKLQSTANT